MTQLPFEDLPAKPSVDVLFESWWPIFWEEWPHKVDKQEAAREFRKAIRAVHPSEIIDGERLYIRNKPDWRNWMGPAKFLRRRRWEDEYDTPAPKPSSYTHDQLQIIAAHVKRDWYKGEYDRDVLQRCVDAGLLTVERMDQVL